MKRLFIDQLLTIGDDLELNSFASNYIARVLRLKLKDTIYLFNGHLPLGEYTATISLIRKKQVSVKIQSFLEKNLESPLQINLLQGISRGDRMDYTIQKAVELGVKQVYPLLLERTHVKLTDQGRQNKKLAHWQAICISALEQSGRTAKVMIQEPKNLSSLVNIQGDLNLVADPLAAQTLGELVLTNAGEGKAIPEDVNILIGPEGGLTVAEIDYAQTQNYIPIRLGPRILRTETAGLAIISYLQTVWGDF